MPSSGTKVCKDCLTEKNVSEFVSVVQRQERIVGPRCADCDRTRRKQIRLLRIDKDRAHIRQMRERAIHVLGNKCQTCEYNDVRALQFDHTNNDGWRDRKERKMTSIKFFKSIIDGRSDITLLCANCHAIKTWWSDR